MSAGERFRPRVDELPEDARRTALAMVRCWWQGDTDTWDQLWAASGEDREDVARALTGLTEHLVQRMARVAGLSTGEMLHRLIGFAMNQPDLTPAHGLALSRSRAATLDERTSRTGDRVEWPRSPAEESPDSTGQGGG